MKKILFTMLCLLVALSTVAFSQWTFVRAYSPFKSPLKPDNLWGSHGIAVDPEGKIWVAPFNATDTLTIGSGTNQVRRELFVFYPNGTKASFSPIKIILGDSLNNNNSGRGLASDQEGNILYSSGLRLFRINYKTGVGMAKIDPAHTGALTAAAVDSAGNVFVSRVVGSALPVKIYGKDFSFKTNALDSTRNILRAFAVSGDGKTLYLPNIYAGGGAPNGVQVYENQFGPGFGVYTFVDSIFRGSQPEAIGWQPRPGKKSLLWVSAGSKENPPTAPWTESTWYGYNRDTKQVVDSIKWGATFPGNPTFDDTVTNAQRRRPRGIVFTASGDTAYVTMFLADSNSVKMFIKGPSGVSKEKGVVARDFELSQNYPNPFNPSTQIKFSLLSTSTISLKVFDVLGKEIATLAEGSYGSGVYLVNFNATNLSAGMYFYTLTTSNGFSQTKKMLLIK